MAPHLSLDERRIIAALLQRQISVAQIGRHRSTVHREIRRNHWHDPEVPLAEGYWHVTTQQRALTRRRRQCKLVRNEALCLAVIDRLRAGWSPEQIAGRMRHEGHRQRVCDETIYRYVHSPEGRTRELGRSLPERRRKRRARYARKPRSLVFPERCVIRYRSEAVGNHESLGHREADLMIFGRELEQGLGAQAWFCDPQAPWQKPTVENTNHRLRPWLPRDTVLLDLSPRDFTPS